MQRTFTSWKERRLGGKAQITQEDSESSFDSSDSAYDSDENDGGDATEAGGDSGESDSEGSSSAEESQEESEQPLSEEPEGKKCKRLGFKEGTLTQLHRLDETSGSETRCIKNPPRPGGISEEKAALGAHTDFGSMVSCYFYPLVGRMI